MTPEEQRIAIAEACGWKRIRIEADGGSYGWVMEKGCFPQDAPACFPDYLSNLNAMHEAENALPQNQKRTYASRLLFGEPSVVQDMISSHGGFQAIHATAAQRAEAFLRTIGKWKET